jgi:hypothetical protein
MNAETASRLAQNSCWVGAVIGLGLVKSFPWTIPIILALVLFGIFLQWRGTNRCHTVPLAAFIFSLITGLSWLAFYLRADYWWMTADDNQWFDAISHSLVHNGPTTDVIASARDGAPAVAYHHLAYFLTGLLDLGVGGETYEVLTRFTPVVLALIAVASCFAFIQSASPSSERRNLRPSVVAVAFSLIFIPISATSFSNHLGFSAVVSSAAVIVCAKRRPDRWSSAVIVALMVPVTAFSKATSMYATFLLIFAVSLLSPPRHIRATVATLLTTVSTIWFLGASSPSSANFDLTLFSPNSIGELASGNRMWRLVSLLVVIAPLVPGFALGVWLWSQTKALQSRALLFGLLAVVVAAYSSRFLVGGRTEPIRYLWEPAMFAGSLVIALAVVEIWNQPGWRRKPPATFRIIALFFVVALGISQLLPDLNSGSSVAKLLRIFGRADFILFVGVSVVLVLRLVGHSRFNPQAKAHHWSIGLLIFAIPIVAVVNQIPWFIENFSEARNGVMALQRGAYLAPRDVIEVGDYLREVTEREDLVAVTLCEYLADGCPTDYSLATYSRRSFLSLGGSFVLYWDPSDLAYTDATKSVLSPSNSLSQAISYWRSRGADYAVVDRKLLFERDHVVLETESRNVVFENRRFAVLSIGPSK